MRVPVIIASFAVGCMAKDKYAGAELEHAYSNADPDHADLDYMSASPGSAPSERHLRDFIDAYLSCSSSEATPWEAHPLELCASPSVHESLHFDRVCKSLIQHILTRHLFLAKSVRIDSGQCQFLPRHGRRRRVCRRCRRSRQSPVVPALSEKPSHR